MVRKYVRKRPRQWRDKDKRMEAAVRLRAAGKSLREIGAALAVNHETVRRDLARWDAQQASAAPANVIQLSQRLPHPGVANDPARGDLRQLNATEDATPIALNARRK